MLLAILFVGTQVGQPFTAQAHRVSLSIAAWSGAVMPVDISADAPPFSSDRLAVTLEGVAAPPTNRQMNAYLLNTKSATGLLCSDLPVANGAINTNCDFPGKPLIGRYDALYFLQERIVFTATVPTNALAYLYQALNRADDTPGHFGYGVGLRSQAQLLADHAGFAKGAADTGNLSGAKQHVEHLLNLLYGSADPRYGDLNNDGVASNPGDGYGLLRYRQKVGETLRAAAESSDTTANLQTRAAQVEVALANIGDGSGDSSDSGWADLLIEKANALLATNDLNTAKALATQIAGLATRIDQGEEVNDNGEIELIAGEGGAQTAWRYTQYAADFLTADGSGYVRYSDANGAAYNDSLRIKLAGLTPPSSGEQYWVYLVSQAGEYFLAGAVDGTNGAIDATLPSAARNLGGAYSGAVVTVGQKVAKGTLPPHARLSLHRAR
ncbi:MAG: hypothetical protein R2867_06690 [Caldilineaceae bacterium]